MFVSSMRGGGGGWGGGQQTRDMTAAMYSAVATVRRKVQVRVSQGPTLVFPQFTFT